ncbi:Tetratrico peptide repeat-containing protein [Nannocystis exedens]|uniref:Tetratrico peptide repeat-containing protein n=1 Tax=Nannocystis exedens TaxID=54 RepID=A0A1I2I3V3_9BACT|nr:tetratricopeptide repeat protein [Nannocystis exedens]PCC73512.1 Tetratrico peptide repeat protein [Nannocystis exedens]SFF35767.1 Tetratrico peptide repeat-containing protein [Nannocystis exedens]
MSDEVARVRELREAKRHEDHLAAACACVARAPGDVLAQIEAAYGLDRAGEEQRALVHYEAARRLGVPASEHRHFTVGYGSTLRNVGRHEDSVAVFAEAAARHPDYPPFAAFLALALESAGRPREALATLLRLTLQVAPHDAFDGYERALTEYQRGLVRR